MFFRFVERAFVVALLLCSMQVITGLTTPSAAQADLEALSPDLHVTSIATGIPLYACGAFLVLMRWRRVLHAARAVWPMVALIALAPLSIVWSAQPALTLRRSLLLFASTLFAIYLGERYTVEKFARLLAQTMCLMMIVIVVLRFVAPTYVIDPSSSTAAWTGLSRYKNAFGEYMGISVVLLSVVGFRQFVWLRYVFLGLAAVLLLLSHSAGSLLTCALVLAAIPLWYLSRLKRRQRLPVYAMAALVLFQATCLLIRNINPLFELLGRDSTLTGRTYLWALVLPAILKHPILGYGYDTFWTGLQGDSQEIRVAAGWMVVASDNGFLDLCLSLGAIGVCVFLCVFALSFRKAVNYIGSGPGSIGLWPITYLTFFLLHSVYESTLLRRGTLSFLIFAVITTALALNRRHLLSSPP